MFLSEVTHLVLVLALQLSLLIAEILFLGLNNDMELRLFALDLLDQFF